MSQSKRLSKLKSRRYDLKVKKPLRVKAQLEAIGIKQSIENQIALLTLGLVDGSPEKTKIIRQMRYGEQ